MASQSTASTSNYRGVSKTTGRGATRTATQESMAWNAANLQVAREGSKAEIASRLADMRARGDITRLVGRPFLGTLRKEGEKFCC